MRLVVAASLILAACSAERQGIAPASASPNWRSVATAADKARLRDWRTAFVEALADARRNGQQALLAREGRLLEPDAAIAGEPPPPGNYRCRTIKIGAKSPGLLSFIAYQPFSCRIDREGDVLSFSKRTGSQRPTGLIFEGQEPRHIFLGTLVLGDETRALDYGDDPLRDMAGAVERIGDRRWRLILPYPHYESIMDVIELVPASAGSDRGAGAARA